MNRSEAKSELTCPNCFKLSLTISSRDKHSRQCRDKNTIPTRWIHIYPSKSHSSNISTNPIKDFLNSLNSKKITWQSGSIILPVNRESLFDDSLEALKNLSEDSWFKEFNVTFINEEGNDAGGLTKEWFDLVMREFFIREYFVRTVTGDGVYSIPTLQDPSTAVNYYVFGKLMGKVLLEKQIGYCKLHKLIFKQILGKKVEFEDLKEFDKEYYEGLLQYKEVDVNQIGDFYFCVEKNVGGQKVLFDLKEDGRRIPVDNGNKIEYIELLAAFEMSNGIRNSLKSLIKGFHSVVDPQLLSRIGWNELSGLINGQEKVNVDELQNYTEYKGEYNSNHPVIFGFWKILKEWDQDRLKKFLQFVLGSSSVPLQGFSELKTVRGENCRFNIVSIPEDNGYPKAHTCFNRLELQVNPDEALMKKRLEFLTSQTFRYYLN